jgi:hypothetical protein
MKRNKVKAVYDELKTTVELQLLRATLEDPIAKFAYADYLEEQGNLEEAKKIRDLTGLVQKVNLVPAYDKRNKGLGIHGVQMHMALIGLKGAVEFIVFTNWQLPEITREWLDNIPHRSVGEGIASYVRTLFCPQSAGITHHSPLPFYEGQEPTGNKCAYLNNKKCYIDGTSDTRIFEILLREGHEGVWKYLQKCYEEVFEDPFNSSYASNK